MISKGQKGRGGGQIFLGSNSGRGWQVSLKTIQHKKNFQII